MKALTFVTILSCLFAAACSETKNESTPTLEERLHSVTVGDNTCVFDDATELLWQTMTRDAGLHQASNTYSWFDPNEANGELDYRGLEDGGNCTGSKCDTWHYVKAVNSEGLCGYDDWRMPDKNEFYSISDVRLLKTPPTTDTNFFPLTESAEYWTGNDYSFQFDAAWAWNFALGHDRVDWKKEAKFVRLVRGTPGELEKVKE